ncbi:uncharacterized protein N7515_000116 [Penicillium bovifimosum]|uniref:Uncharacterized protein n=1 Tax=Penicillium bovifimosum TaxID=126998 RepID=A0A9W9HER7_9EURO|nr:uncharacterized protein N7515_000116 [Penicillium bovifimosum]KAJ5145552.1 hypothetical protein N7515_000116 [Penicillium bovifimosum]
MSDTPESIPAKWHPDDKQLFQRPSKPGPSAPDEQNAPPCNRFCSYMPSSEYHVAPMKTRLSRSDGIDWPGFRTGLPTSPINIIYSRPGYK